MNKQQIELEAWKLKTEKESINEFLGFSTTTEQKPEVTMQWMKNEGWLQ